MAAKHTNRQDFSLRCRAGPDFHLVQLFCGEFGVFAAEGGAVLVYAVPGGGARNVRAVAAGAEPVGAAVQRVVVGVRGVLFGVRGGGVVAVSYQVHARSDLGAVNQP